MANYTLIARFGKRPGTDPNKEMSLTDCAMKVRDMENWQLASTTHREDAETERKCVLIVEDNPLNMEPFSALVASQGYRVLQATEGWRGIDLAHQENPDLIIMVFSYQPRRGPDLTHSLKLKINIGDTPIIVTPAYVPDDHEVIRARGYDGHTAKPIPIASLSS